MTKEKKGDFTLIVPRGKSDTDNFEINLRDLDEPTFLAASSMLKADKHLEAIKFLVKSLYVSGDSPDDFVKDFHAVRSAVAPMTELIKPLEGSLKKN